MVFCAETGCGVLVLAGRCREHQRTASQSRGYTKRWSRRARAFRAKYPLCGMRPDGRAPVMSRCHDDGRTTIASQVDHVVPHNGREFLFWDELGNWQSLCSECHSRKTRAGL